MYPPVLEVVKSLAKQRIPIVEWLPKYTLPDAVSDVVAGITVGLTLMPQAIAYAALAGVDPQYGLYSGWIGSLVYIIFGSTPEVSIGPTALLSLLTFTYTHDTNPDMVALLCFLAGCLELFCGALQLGFLVDFVSAPVVSGFTSAAALIIASSQLKGLFGLKYNADSFISTWRQFFEHCHEMRVWDLVLGVVCIVVLLSLRKLKDIKVGDGVKPLIGSQHVLANVLWFASTARNATVVLVCTVIAYVLHTRGYSPFILTGSIEAGLPTVSLPPTSTVIDGKYYGFFDMVSHLGSGLLVVPLIAIISNIAIAKAFSNGARIDATQELLALGICNVIGSFVHSLPVAGAFSRSAVNSTSGVRTCFGALYTSILVLLALGLLTPYFYFIPKTSLAAVIMCAVLFMVEYEVVKPMWSSNRRDLVPAFATFMACLCIGVEVGLLIGVLIDLMFLLYYSARPLITTERVNSTPGAVYWLVKPRGSLLFPAVDYIYQTITSNATAKSEEGIKSRAVVLDCTHITRTDFSAAKGLHAMIIDMKKQGVHCILLNAGEKIVKTLTTLNQDIKVADSHQALYQILIESTGNLKTDMQILSKEEEIRLNGLDSSREETKF